MYYLPSYSDCIDINNLRVSHSEGRKGVFIRVAKIFYKIVSKLQKNLKSLQPLLCGNVVTSDRPVVELLLQMLESRLCLLQL